MSGIVHGHSRYNNHGCRCQVCTEANRIYNREYMVRRRAMLLAASLPLETPPEGRFVVRSVIGFNIKPGSNTSGNAREVTRYNVLDRLDCHRIAYTPPDSANEMQARGMCEREAARLNALHAEAVAA